MNDESKSTRRTDMCTRIELTDETAAHRSVARRPRRLRALLAVGGAAVAAAALLAAALVAGAAEPTHEVTLVARGMAFHLPEGGGPNPAIEVGRGEPVRLILVNRDRGIDHDLALPSLDLATEAIPGDGRSVSLEFRAPETPGVHEYVCQLHGKMMRGSFIIR